MSDRDIVCAFFPEHRPDKPRTPGAHDMRKVFWDIGRGRGMSERQIQAAWVEHTKGRQ